MSPSCLAKPNPRVTKLMIAGLMTCLSILAAPADAATTPESGTVRQPSAVYDAAHEITFDGVIEKLITARVVGSPVGAHLLVSGPQGLVDVHAGPYLSKDKIDALQSGAPIQVVGAMVSLHGKQYLLARLLTVNGQTLTVRSQGGVLLHQYGNRTTKSAKNARVEANGDVR